MSLNAQIHIDMHAAQNYTWELGIKYWIIFFHFIHLVSAPVWFFWYLFWMINCLQVTVDTYFIKKGKCSCRSLFLCGCMYAGFDSLFKTVFAGSSWQSCFPSSILAWGTSKHPQTHSKHCHLFSSLAWNLAGKCVSKDAPIIIPPLYSV